MPGWDDRKLGRGDSFGIGREGGAVYERSWQAAISSSPDWIVVTSFNEWPEGTYIEPSQAFGNRYLELTAKWAAAFKSATMPQPPPPAAAPANVPVPASVVAPAPKPTVAPSKPTTAAPKPTPKPVPPAIDPDTLMRWRAGGETEF
jgi:hypothetical protein